MGNHRFDVGILSDLHICASNDNNSPETNDNWWDEDDFKTAMDIFVADKDIKFVASCGDIAESQTNDYRKHPEATCDKDYAEFTEMYDVPYWQVAGLRFFAPLGNHDFYGIFESRYGDTITGKKNTETIIGYNAGVQSRLGLWVTGQQINGIVPGRGRIVFDLEKGKSTAQGQADMRFFSFCDYVDLYCKQGGYTGSSIWDASKGGISDEAIRCAKKYVSSNWAAVKDSLVMWDDGGGHGRNGYSKLNYWMKTDNNIFVFLSVDYGNDTWGVTSGWHDRMIHARTLIDLSADDPYVRRMKEFVSDTGYSAADAKYDYQYYSPNALIWLKEIIENNTDCKIFVFTHHYLPNKVGNSTGIPKNGDWSYADISKAGVLTSDGINKGSNCLTGIEFWFMNKLNNLYKNVVWFSGHSHISYECPNHVDCHDYAIVSPADDEKYAYTKANNTPVGNAAYSVALPSLSKPRYVNGSETKRLYDDAEITIMKVYDNGVVLNGYKIKKDNKNVFDKDNPLFTQTIALTGSDVQNRTSATTAAQTQDAAAPEPETEPAPDGIRIVFNNQTGEDIRFSGKFLPYVQEQDDAMPLYLCAPNKVDDWCHWSENCYSLKAGATVAFDFTELTDYSASKGKLIPKKISLDKYYGKHFRLKDTAVE